MRTTIDSKQYKISKGCPLCQINTAGEHEKGCPCNPREAIEKEKMKKRSTAAHRNLLFSFNCWSNDIDYIWNLYSA